MVDPSQGVPPALLPHIHLVSLYRYPLLPQLGLETVVNYLLEAPRITREAAGMSWTFLDAPQDGTVMLVWQPLAQMGTGASSDGYLWADPEQAFSSEAKGYTVEMYVHRSGYHPPHEQVATHSRRRYRLLPAQNSTNPNPVTCDPSLWILHYSRADPQNQIPSNRIPVSNQNHSLTQRKYLQQHGQLVRKDFMLHDRNNWPTINLPGGNMPHYGPQNVGYPGNVISHMNRSQQQTYLQQQQHQHQHHQQQHQHQQQQQHQQHQQQQQQQQQQQHQQHQPAPGNQGIIGPPASKRMRHSHGPNLLQRPSNGIAGAAMGHDGTIDDEEDNSRGDLMDFLTPRDVSTMRYVQHHEWMEEIFNSPYTTGQIVPVELGIGRKGELEDLTKDFFSAPTDTTPTVPLPSGTHPPRVGRLEAGKAEEFTSKATEKVAELNAEMERMKRQHAQRMARLNKGTAIRLAERSLRSAPMSAADFGIDEWKFGGSARSSASGDAALSIEQKSIDQITKEMESVLGKKIKLVKELDCIQNGGLEEKSDMAENDGQEYDLVSPLAKIDGHGNQLTSYAESEDLLLVDQDHAGSMGHTPQPSLEGVENSGVEGELPKSNETFLDGDVAMSEMPDPSETKDLETGDWVMVNKENDSGRSHHEESPSLENLTNIATPQTSADARGGALDTTSDTLPNFAPTDSGNAVEDFTTNEFSEAIDFGNLDTAGEALSGYGAEHSGMGLDDPGDLGLDDSAFGAAFHPTQASPVHQSDRLGHDG